ncbi:hypothetical protein ACP70R_017808 [Stipagrostis hirtigluma subsp. patula]
MRPRRRDATEKLIIASDRDATKKLIIADHRAGGRDAAEKLDVTDHNVDSAAPPPRASHRRRRQPRHCREAHDHRHSLREPIGIVACVCTYGWRAEERGRRREPAFRFRRGRDTDEKLIVASHDVGGRDAETDHHRPPRTPPKSSSWPTTAFDS